MSQVVHHEHIIGHWQPLNGVLRDKQRDAIDWFENTMPMKYVRRTAIRSIDKVVYKLGKPLNEVKHPAMGYRGDVKIFTDGHIEWHPASPWATATARSFLNPVDAVMWLMLDVMHAELPTV